MVALERKIDWQIARKRGQIKTIKEGTEKETLKAGEKVKASVRAFVEHPFHIVKNLFRHRKVRYREPGQERASTLHTLWPGQCGDRRANGHGVKNHAPNLLKRKKRWPAPPPPPNQN